MNDIKLIRQLKEYRQVNQELADTALSVISRHLWYISDIALGFTFFDNRHSQETLTQMSRALKKPGDERNLFRNISIDFENEEDLDLTKMISKNTLKFFDIVRVNYDFIQTPPSLWHENENYKKIDQIVRGLSTVNDPAERAIGLLKTVNNTLTMNFDEQNDLIQVIEEYNKKHPNANKSTILKNLREKK